VSLQSEKSEPAEGVSKEERSLLLSWSSRRWAESPSRERRVEADERVCNGMLAGLRELYWCEGILKAEGFESSPCSKIGRAGRIGYGGRNHCSGRRGAEAVSIA
jgi:hypothetical protein